MGKRQGIYICGEAWRGKWEQMDRELGEQRQLSKEGSQERERGHSKGAKREIEGREQRSEESEKDPRVGEKESVRREE